jgi:DNA helicase-2/ATP-dependent DNA helicase PcrA
MSVQATDAMSTSEADRLLDGLNPQQRQVVVTEGSPLLIVAGWPDPAHHFTKQGRRGDA